MLVLPFFSRFCFLPLVPPLSLFLPLSPFSVHFLLIYHMLVSFSPPPLTGLKTINCQHQKDIRVLSLQDEWHAPDHSYSPAEPWVALGTSDSHSLTFQSFPLFRAEILESGSFLAVSVNFLENNPEEQHKRH